MADNGIPVIDIAPFRSGDPAARRDVARAVDQACCETGFFTVTGHGVSEELIARTRRAAADFFALPAAEKAKVMRPPQKISRGYFPLGDRSLAYSLGVAAPPDIHEAYACGREGVSDRSYRDGDVRAAMLARNIWPDEPAEFRPTLLAYYDAMTALASDVLRICAMALGVEEDFFADKFDHPSSVIRLIRYPAQDTAPLPGQLRAGAHTDYGTLTFVRGDDVPGGLQTRLRSGGWTDVHPVPGAFVCNIADAMARWTNDRWVSTLHRVANPPGDGAKKDRISLVFFQMPDHDAEIRCIPGCAREGAGTDGGGGAKYPPVTFADHYLGKVMKAAHSRLDAGTVDAAVRD